MRNNSPVVGTKSGRNLQNKLNTYRSDAEALKALNFSNEMYKIVSA